MTADGRVLTAQEQGEGDRGLWQDVGTRSFHCAGEVLPFALGDFWHWAAGNLAGNVLRGWVAEFLVSASLGQRGQHRREWDACDLRLANAAIGSR